MNDVYIDVLFAFNFAVDYVILSLTVAISHEPVRELRTVLGAFAGAVGACIVFFVPATLSVWVKIVTVAASGTVAFGKRRTAQYLKLFTLLFCVTAAFGGGIYALCSVFGITRGAAGYMDIPIWLFAVIFAALYFPIKLAYSIFNRKRGTEGKTVDAYVTLCGKCFAVKLLSDTGSTLKEPISGRYVMLVDGEGLSQTVETAKCKGAVVIPFVSAGNPNGMLTGVFADSVVAGGRCLPKTAIAPVGFTLSQSGQFNAVISSEALLHI